MLPGLPDRRVDDDHHDRLQHRLEVAFRAALGDRLAALVAYGSAADGTFIAGFSDFDLAVFLRGEFSPDDAVAAQAALGDLDPAPFDYLQTKFIDLSLPPTPTLVPDSYLVFAGSLPSEPAYLYNDASLRRSGRKWLDDLPALIAADAAAWSVAAGSKRRRRLVRLMMTRLKPGLRAFLVERGESPAAVWPMAWPDLAACWRQHDEEAASTLEKVLALLPPDGPQDERACGALVLGLLQRIRAATCF